MPPSARAARPEDRGTSLVELVVAMGIFSTVLSVIVGATMVMVQDVNKGQNVYDASADARAVFSRMDKQIRYATGINRPGSGVSGTDEYVEFQGIDGSNVATCYQWRHKDATGELQLRSWVGTPSTAPLWTTVATSVVNPPGQPPFVFTAATPAAPRQSLTVSLVVSRGSVQAGTSTVSTTFAARNTDTSSLTNPDADADGRTDVPVCTGVARS